MRRRPEIADCAARQRLLAFKKARSGRELPADRQDVRRAPRHGVEIAVLSLERDAQIFAISWAIRELVRARGER